LFLEILNIISGSYGATSNVEILLDKKSTTANLGDVARLNRIRMVVTDETKIGDKMNESAIKTMTSGIGKIVARFLYGNEFEFTPIFKIFMATNHKPVIRGTDHGIWRRLKIIPFNRVFEKHEQDKELIIKLKDELNEIFTWAVEGAGLWYEQGLQEPAILEETIKEYRTEMDLIQRWIDEACDVGEFKETARDLFENFNNYVSINKEFQMSQTLFGRNISKKFKKRRLGGQIYYEGIRLKKDSIYWLDEKTYKEI
jgi:putative DNA primase/helicase